MIRVLLADDEHMVRGALLALIELEDDLRVVAEVERGDAVISAVLRDRPDVAVLDIDMTGLDGLTVAERMGEQTPDTRVLILTGIGQPSHLTRSLAAGVAGFLRKNAPPGELADAIRRVAKGQRFLDPELVQAALSGGSSPLTERETEVLRAAAAGGSTADIAAEIHLAAPTVRNYLSSAFAKLGARNRTDAVRIARESGWI